MTEKKPNKNVKQHQDKKDAKIEKRRAEARANYPNAITRILLPSIK